MVPDQFLVPDEAVKYILFQRTGYLRFPVTKLYRHVLRHVPVHLPIYNLVVGGESRIGRSRVKALYLEDMRSEYDSIRDHLPGSCSSVLDIGCGMAGIDVFIDRHYTGQYPAFYLLDKTTVDRSVFYMFNQEASFYNSLDVARTLLTANGIPLERVHLREATAGNEVDVPHGVDLVLSLLSWGFHYPVDTYAESVNETLSDTGIVIMDVRKGTGGTDVLRRVFGRMDVISETKKQFRVAARKGTLQNSLSMR